MTLSISIALIWTIEIKSHERKGFSMPVRTIDQEASSVDPTGDFQPHR